jgi:hypothetical protein
MPYRLAPDGLRNPDWFVSVYRSVGSELNGVTHLSRDPIFWALSRAITYLHGMGDTAIFEYPVPGVGMNDYALVGDGCNP